MDNIYVKTDPAGNIKPDKEKNTDRIDGAIALVMALDRAVRNENITSVYDGRWYFVCLIIRIACTKLLVML